jgi:hypothetical protein
VIWRKTSTAENELSSGEDGSVLSVAFVVEVVIVADGATALGGTTVVRDDLIGKEVVVTSVGKAVVVNTVGREVAGRGESTDDVEPLVLIHAEMTNCEVTSRTTDRATAPP